MKTGPDHLQPAVRTRDPHARAGCPSDTHVTHTVTQRHRRLLEVNYQFTTQPSTPSAGKELNAVAADVGKIQLELAVGPEQEMCEKVTGRTWGPDRKQRRQQHAECRDCSRMETNGEG